MCVFAAGVAREHGPHTASLPPSPLSDDKPAAPAPPPPDDAAAAAAAAASRARRKARAAARVPRGAGVKVFVAGVRWGVRLHADSLADRSALAAALTRHLEKDGVDAGDGGSLGAVVLGRDGRTTAFAPRDEEAWAPPRWAAAAESAARVYVSGVGPAAREEGGETTAAA